MIIATKMASSVRTMSIEFWMAFVALVIAVASLVIGIVALVEINNNDNDIDEIRGQL